MSNSGGINDTICDHEDINCVKNVWKQNSTNFEELCGCLPECNKIDYNFEVIEEKRAKFYKNYLYMDITASISFSDDEYIAYKRFESYGAVSLLSNIGGLLGLFLGISLLSIVEIVYFVTLRLFDDLWFKLVHLRSK